MTDKDKLMILNIFIKFGKFKPARGVADSKQTFAKYIKDLMTINPNIKLTEEEKLFLMPYIFGKDND